MSRPHFRLSKLADRDVDDHFACIAKDGVDAAVRFFDAFDNACVMLANMPGVGARRNLRRRELRNVRSWPIKGFENFLILYRPADRGIEVLRVLHGARDVDAILNEFPLSD